ncbi:putative sulfate exporter family transporter [Agromyces tardus]|uniref:Putative sulfate exporter family transporter n=1 Tax=Agromyces tardus TaxID=2583849 RepID=A0A3M8A4K6_9MICO|nr:putative sulfate exporter family transporter [Agromyces tardus]RNB46143.1 putative sulfate exporter family transporter [Agromyces tardus]
MTDGPAPGSAPDPASGRTAGRVPGLAVAASAALVAWLVHLAVPAVPLLTAAVALGIVVAQLRPVRDRLEGTLAPGLAFSARTLLRAGIVLLGLKLSLLDIAGLGWITIATTVLVVVLTFAGTLGLGRALGLPGHEPVLVASGFAICGASAIGAMGAAVRARDDEQATPVALVTLCGTLAIAVLPALWHPLGLTAPQFGHWVGAGVHDVGQVVATAQVAGTSALAVAVVVKLTRVLLLAPMVAIAASVERRRATDAAGPHPAIVPLFVVGFLAAVLLRTFVPLPEWLLTGADLVQTTLLAMALFALGASIRVAELVRTGWRALVVGLTSWVLVAALACGAVLLG